MINGLKQRHSFYLIKKDKLLIHISHVDESQKHAERKEPDTRAHKKYNRLPAAGERGRLAGAKETFYGLIRIWVIALDSFI